MRTARSSSHWGGSASVHAGIDPPGCGPGNPLGQIPLNFPLGCGPGNPPWPDPPQLPLWMWAWRPPQILHNFPLGCGPGDPLPWPDPSQLPPWVWVWKPARHAGIPPPGDLLQGMLGYHLQCMLGYHPPPHVDRMTDTCKNITFANFVCGR